MKIGFGKMAKNIFKIFIIFLISGLAFFVIERFFMPWAANCNVLKGVEFFKNANERVTIINKTEQITVKEDFSLTKVTENISPAVVSVITFKNGDNGVNDGGLLKIKSSDDIENRIKTGIILTSDGVVVSVIDEWTKGLLEKDGIGIGDNLYKILGSNGQEYNADLLAVDYYSNLVFYKIAGENFSVPKFGDSDTLENGEKIIICGNTGGEYQNIYFQGIVQENDRGFSLLNSELSSSEKMEGAVMTSVEISSRNVGGPVIDFDGAMVGIANRIEKDGKNVGFIMPINNIISSINEIVKSKKIERPYFGAYYLPIDREIAILNHLSNKNGALVYSFSGQQGLAVIKNSPADKAGIKIGDVIIEAGGKKIDLYNSLSKIISGYKKGDKLEMKIARKGEEQILNVTLE